MVVYKKCPNLWQIAITTFSEIFLPKKQEVISIIYEFIDNTQNTRKKMCVIIKTAVYYYSKIFVDKNFLIDL